MSHATMSYGLPAGCRSGRERSGYAEEFLGIAQTIGASNGSFKGDLCRASVAVRPFHVRGGLNFVIKSAHGIVTDLHVAAIKDTGCDLDFGIDDRAFEEFSSEIPRGLANFRADTASGEIIHWRMNPAPDS